MYKIMVVDDEPIIRCGLKSMIQRLHVGFQLTCEASDGNEALNHMNTYMPDAVITDIKMPFCDGLELVKNLEKRYHNVLKVILSGYNDFTYAQTAIKYNVYDFLLKPINEQNLKTLLDSMGVELDKRQHEKRMMEYLNLHMSGKISFLFGSQKSHELVNSIKFLDMEHAESTAHELFEYFEKNKIQPVHAYNFLLELINVYFIELKVNAMQSNNYKIDWIEDVTDDSSYVYRRLFNWFTGMIRDIIQYIKKDDDSDDSAQIRRIKAYIQEHYTNDITLGTLSNRFYINANYLSGLFKAKTGKNFIDYLTETRLERAIDLLKENQFTVGQIASMVGYESSNHFSRLFKKYAGISPGEYRKTIGIDKE